MSRASSVFTSLSLKCRALSLFLLACYLSISHSSCIWFSFDCFTLVSSALFVLHLILFLLDLRQCRALSLFVWMFRKCCVFCLYCLIVTLVSRALFVFAFDSLLLDLRQCRALSLFVWMFRKCCVFCLYCLIVTLVSRALFVFAFDSLLLDLRQCRALSLFVWMFRKCCVFCLYCVWLLR